MPSLCEKVTGPVFVGNGRVEEFGIGDDVLIRSSDNMIDLSDWEVLWSGSAT
jgi:hypothetical protein